MKDTRPHHKNIEDGLKIERPHDLVVKILSTKFAIVQPALMNGGFGDPFIAGISGGLKVFSFGSLKYIKDTCESIARLENVKKQVICYDFPENKRYNVYLKKNSDQRKYKQEYRKLSKLI